MRKNNTKINYLRLKSMLFKAAGGVTKDKTWVVEVRESNEEPSYELLIYPSSCPAAKRDFYFCRAVNESRIIEILRDIMENYFEITSPTWDKLVYNLYFRNK